MSHGKNVVCQHYRGHGIFEIQGLKVQLWYEGMSTGFGIISMLQFWFCQWLSASSYTPVK